MVDGFRTRKETAKATAVAAEAIVRIRQYADDIELTEPDPAITPANLPTTRRRASSNCSLRAAGCWPQCGPALPTAEEAALSRPENDVFTLRADPLGSGALIFFAEEPVGTLTLLSVLDDRHAVDEHHDAAV